MIILRLIRTKKSSSAVNIFPWIMIIFSTYGVLYNLSNQFLILPFFTILAETGLSEGEIEDILSLNDIVLNDIYQFWVPPERRLPPLLWVRVKNDIEEYLVHR